MKVEVCSDLGVRGLPEGSETRQAGQDSALYPQSNRKPPQCFEQRSSLTGWRGHRAGTVGGAAGHGGRAARGTGEAEARKVTSWVGGREGLGFWLSLQMC